MPHRRLIAPIGLTALLGFVIAAPFTAARVHADGPPTCHLSESGHCVVPPSNLGVVETPMGPEVIGTEALAPIVAYITHVVAVTTSGTCVTACDLPTADVNTAAALNATTASNTDGSNGGYSSGGCAGNSTCTNLHLVWHETDYWGNNQANDEWRGAVSYNDLWPDGQENDLNNNQTDSEWDFLTSLATPESWTWSICSIQLTFSSNTSASSPVDWWPRGSFPVPDGGSQTLSVSGTYKGVSVGVSSTWASSQGFVEGDMQGNNGAPNFAANWAYQDQNGNGASDCNWASVALDGGVALRTAVGSDAQLVVGTSGTGYEGS